MLEGLAILCELHHRFRPRLEGYDQDGTFSGYAARYLPRRLGDAWHRMHPEHRYVTDPATGKRYWRYDTPPTSLDGMLAPESDEHHEDGGLAMEAKLDTARRVHEFTPVPEAQAA